MPKHFMPYHEFDVSKVQFAIGSDRHGKPTIAVTYNEAAEVALCSAPAITMWPRVNGDGNFGTMWGPTDPSKAKYTLDLTDNEINGDSNTDFASFQHKMDGIDDQLLAFVTENQMRLLGRKNLSQEEVKMLQVRTIKPKYDKMSGALSGYVMNLSASKWAWDGMGGKFERQITVCDHKGIAVPHGEVRPGDVVAATVYANQVYTGVGGDKFGIQWGFDAVQVVCQRAQLDAKTEEPAFMNNTFPFAKEYKDSQAIVDAEAGYCSTEQFGAV
mgnify:CR=1 FL=1